MSHLKNPKILMSLKWTLLKMSQGLSGLKKVHICLL